MPEYTSLVFKIIFVVTLPGTAADALYAPTVLALFTYNDRPMLRPNRLGGR
jgi:hypothetical protein